MVDVAVLRPKRHAAFLLAQRDAWRLSPWAPLENSEIEGRFFTRMWTAFSRWVQGKLQEVAHAEHELEDDVEAARAEVIAELRAIGERLQELEHEFPRSA
jgi:hypothetical protein